MTAVNARAGRTPAIRDVRHRLLLGAAAGPVYVTVGVVQTVTRDGFDITRHPVSVLSNGPFGWVQMLNFVISGLLVVAAATGLRRSRAAGRWMPGLVGVYGVGLIASGVFVADPVDGFPPGTPPGIAAAISWHGALHLLAGAVAFAALVAACLLFSRRCSARGQPGWALYSAATGFGFLAAWAALVATGAARPWVNVAFALAVAGGWLWLTLVLVRLGRRRPLSAR